MVTSQETRTSHFYWLDLLRFFAALTVVVAHARAAAFVDYGRLEASEQTVSNMVLFSITRFGSEAVVVFFVLSGFLVGGRGFVRIIEGSFKPTDYAVDRIVRIALPLIPALALTAVVRIVIEGDFNLLHLVGNLFSLQGVFVPPFGENGPLWSLSYEVWFYVLVYAVGTLAEKNDLRWLSFALLILVAGIFTSLSTTYLFCWLIGAVAFARRPSAFSGKVLAASVLLCGYAVIGSQIGQDSKSLAVDTMRIYLPSLEVSRVLLATGMAMIVQQVICLEPRTAFLGGLNRAGTVLAASSYTLYLTHYPILQLMTDLGLQRATTVDSHTVTVFFGCMLSCFIASWILYFLFERHTDWFKKAIKSRMFAQQRMTSVPVS